EIAKERGISSKEVLAVLQKAGLDVKAAASSVDEDDIARAFSNGAESAAAEQPKAEAAPAGDGAQAREKSAPRQPEQAGQQPQQEEPATQINSGATVKEVAESLGLGASEVIKKLMELGEMATLTQTLSDEAIGVLADEFDKKIEITHAADEVAEEPEYEDTDE